MGEEKRMKIPDEYKFQVSLAPNHEVIEVDNVLYYKPNRITKYLHKLYNSEAHKVISQLWCAQESDLITVEELMQYYRDIGYSLCGFEEIFEETLKRMQQHEKKKVD